MSVGGQTGPSCGPPGAAPGYVYTLAALAFIAHNVEELVGLPDWAALDGIVEVNRPGFATALIWVTLLAVVILLLGRTFQFNLWIQRAVAVLAGALLLNAASHAAISLVTWTYMPGLATALLMILPSFGWLLARLPLVRREKLIAALAGLVLMPAVAILALRLSGAIR